MLRAIGKMLAATGIISACKPGLNRRCPLIEASSLGSGAMTRSHVDAASASLAR